jgi:hypothetical protein
MKKILLTMFITLFLIGIASASYLPHKQNTDLEFSITSNFATYCTLTNINTPTKMVIVNQNGTNNLQTFNWTINKENLTELGVYNLNIMCSDGTDTVTGSVEREVNTSGQGGTENIVFFLFLILLLYGITFTGFFGKNIPLTVLGGMAMMFLGVYLVSQGIIVYRDNITNYIAYLTISIGAITSFWALLEQFEII